MLGRVFSIAAIVGIAVAASCGLAGNSPDDGFGGHAAASSSSTGTPPGTGGAGGNIVLAGGSGPGGTATTTGTPSPTTDTSAGGSTGTTSSTPTGSTSSSGGPCSPSDPGVCCTVDACAENCCYANGVATCQSGMCSGGQHYRCDASTDCTGGQLCCIHWDHPSQSYTGDVKCVSATSCVPPLGGSDQTGNFEVCTYAPDGQGDPTQSTCAAGFVCMQDFTRGGANGFCYYP
ncbi:MAG TPA: hypothetical protein VHB21_04510 [Minicystis sp.]|nr:hypothetical protein [Minicystis sp.]